MSYRIEKVRCAVTVVLAGGESHEGEIFLNPTSRFRSQPQDPAEFLNEEDEYFALAMASGRAALVAKTRVESVEVPERRADGAADPPLQPVQVEFRLASGSVLAGAVLIDTPPSHARLLDFLNSRRDRFLRVSGTGRVTLVNRQAIAYAQELT